MKNIFVRRAAVRVAPTMLALFVFCIALAGEFAPFKGWGSGSVVGAVPVSTGLQLTLVGSGQSTMLGRFSRSEVLVVGEAGQVNGTIDFTAANGDVLSVSVAGQFVSPTTVKGTYTVTGGTGRFAGATGSADFTAISPDGLHLTFEFDGQVSTIGG